MLTESQAAYIAGLFDAEGTICMRFRPPNPSSREINEQVEIQVVLAMTHKDTVEYICNLTGTKMTYSDHSRDKRIYKWRPSLKTAESVFLQASKYMIAKKRNAELFLEIRDIRKMSTRSDRRWDRQVEIVLENKKINSLGCHTNSSQDNIVLRPEYFAGLFDGEGYVSIVERKSNKTVVVGCGVSMTNEPTIDALIMKYGGSKGKKVYDNGWRDCFTWKPGTDQFKSFVEDVTDYLITKRKNVDMFNEISELRKLRSSSTLAAQRKIAARNRAINEGGE